MAKGLVGQAHQGSNLMMTNVLPRKALNLRVESMALVWKGDMTRSIAYDCHSDFPPAHTCGRLHPSEPKFFFLWSFHDRQTVKYQQHWYWRCLSGDSVSFVHTVAAEGDSVKALRTKGIEVSALVARHWVTGTLAAALLELGAGDIAECGIRSNWSRHYRSQEKRWFWSLHDRDFLETLN